MSAPPQPPVVCENCVSFARDRRSKWPGRCKLSRMGVTDGMRGCYFFEINPPIVEAWERSRERERTADEARTPA